MSVESLPFVGRKKALSQLNALLKKKTATLAVINGRRRIGKSRLIEEFSKAHRCLTFVGIPPEPGVTAHDQRAVFAHTLGLSMGIPSLKTDDWMSLLDMLADHTRSGRVVIVLDEITWMAMEDPTFLGKLKTAWDTKFKKNPELILILCGSVSIWIEQNILSSTGYLGRIPLVIHVDELSLFECNQLLTAQQLMGSAYEKFQLLSVTGGIPWYLELIPPASTVSACIQQLCFTPHAPLAKEFNHIFHDLFDSKGAIYKKIIVTLENGPLEYNEICDALHYSRSGMMSDYLHSLVTANFVTRDFTWGIKNGKTSRLSKFRLSDNYVRFYLKLIEPQIDNINKGYYENMLPSDLPGWHTLMGLQFENLVLKNRHAILRLLGIHPIEVLIDNPYFQRKTERQRGCQIDYMIQTRLNTLFICEIKFSRNEITTDVITAVKEKIARMSVPKQFSCIPVLIHVNGVNNAVYDQGYFYKIIDFSDLLLTEI